MELRHLRYFVATAEELNMGRAAQRLRVAQSALSRQLQDLERELGADLFERLSRGIRLTPAGEALLVHARGVLSAADAAAAAVRAAAEGQTGSLRVGTVDYGEHPPRVAAALARFRADHPRVELVVDHTPWTQQQAAVRDARLDVGLCPAMHAERLLDGLDAEPLHTERVNYAVLAATHPLADRDEIRLADLRDVPMLLPERSVYPAMYDEIIETHRRAGVEPRVITSAPTPVATVVQQVSAGAGYVLIFESVGRAGLPGVRAVRVRDCDHVVRLFALRRAGDARPLVASVLRRLREAYGVGPAGG